MKNETLILGLSAIGLGAYLWIKSRNNGGFDLIPAAQAISSPNIQKELQLAAGVSQAVEEGAINASQGANLQALLTNTLDSNAGRRSRLKSGIDLINNAIKQNVNLPKSSTLYNKVTVKEIATGEKRTGRVAQLSNGTIKFISVRNV